MVLELCGGSGLSLSNIRKPKDTHNTKKGGILTAAKVPPAVARLLPKGLTNRVNFYLYGGLWGSYRVRLGHTVFYSVKIG